MSKKRTRVLLFIGRIWKIPAVLGGLALLGGVGTYFFPLEVLEFGTRAELWFLGVHQVQFPSLEPRLSGYMNNSCGEGERAVSDCICVGFLHGMGDSGLSWKRILNARREVWQAMGVVRPLKLLALDLPGTGKSARPKDLSQYRVRRQAEVVVSALKLQCGQWILVGNSMGGWIAAWAALEWPEGIQRLVLLSPSGIGRLGTSQAKLLTDPTIETMKEFKKKAYFKSDDIPDYIWREIVRRAKALPSKDIVQAQKEEDFLETQFSTLSLPIMMIWGQEDGIIPLNVGKQMRDMLHSVIWREVPECGHLLQKECPLPVIRGIVDLMNFGAM